MRGGGGPDYDLGDVFGREGFYAFVDLGGALGVSAEADEAEVGLYHAGIDACDTDWRSQHILAKAIVNQALSCFGSAIDGAIGVGEFAGSGAETDDVTAATHDHSRNNGTGDVEQPFTLVSIISSQSSILPM